MKGKLFILLFLFVQTKTNYMSEPLQQDHFRVIPKNNDSSQTSPLRGGLRRGLTSLAEEPRSILKTAS